MQPRALRWLKERCTLASMLPPPVAGVVAPVAVVGAVPIPGKAGADVGATVACGWGEVIVAPLE